MKAILLVIGTVLLLGFILWVALPYVLFGTTDAYLRFSPGNSRDANCEIQGMNYLESKDVDYPQGFICSSFLPIRKYTSKTRCGCYRGDEMYEFAKDRNGGTK